MSMVCTKKTDNGGIKSMMCQDIVRIFSQWIPKVYSGVQSQKTVSAYFQISRYRLLILRCIADSFQSLICEDMLVRVRHYFCSVKSIDSNCLLAK